jgi:hypothetical protein
MELTDNAGAPLTVADGIAPTMGTCASLFQSMEMRINDKVVSRIGDFCGQIDAIENRLAKSNSWLNTAGNSTNLWQSDLQERMTVTASDGKKGTDVVNEKITPLADATTVAVSTAGVVTLAGQTNGVAGGTPLVQVGDKMTIVNKEYTVMSAVAGDATFQVSALGLLTAVVARPVVDAGNPDITFSRARNVARKLKEFELIWTPPLSLFKITSALPSGDYELMLVPQPGVTFQQYGVESLASKAPNVNYKMSVKDIYFYCNVVDGKRADDITYLLDLDETSCQSDNIRNPGLTQRNFDVSPSTYALTACYQDLRVGTDTRFSTTKFKSYDVNGNNATELNLNRFYLQYAGQSLPSPDADPQFDVNIDRTTQRYADSMLYSGAIFDSGGCETIEEFHRRGSYYHFAIPRDGSDRSTQVVVNQQFEGNTNIDNMRVLLFSHYKKVARVSVSDGRVVDVTTEDA